MLEERKLWRDREIIPWNEATVHIFSHSFSRGSAIFEVISTHKTYRGTAIFRLKDHLKRLERSAKAIGMNLPYSKSELIKACCEVVAINQVGHGMIKIVAWYPEIGFEIIPHSTDVSLLILAVEFGRDISLTKHEEANTCSAAISKWRKLDPNSVPVFCKASGNYLSPMVAKLEVKKRGYDVPILIDKNGYIAEGATESIFLVKKGKIYTPKVDNILPGITRRSAIKLARDMGLNVIEKEIEPEFLLKVDEAFFSSTTTKIWPVRKIENRKLDCPGLITRKLKERFDQVVSGELKSYRNWLYFIG